MGMGCALGSGWFQARFREGNADTHHTGLEAIALISQNDSQRKCHVPRNSSPVANSKGQDRLGLFVSYVAPKMLPLPGKTHQ